ncbi:MAG: ATP synthase F1 subunit epsilon [Polymorphobacter sp.]
MADLLHFELVSPEKLLRSGSVFMVVVPGAEGDFGVLAGHAPFMSTIRPGAIQVYATGMADTPERIFIDGGFAEVGAGGLTILAEAALPVAEIAVEAVAAELGLAREKLRLATDAGEQRSLGAQVARLEAMQAVVTN